MSRVSEYYGLHPEIHTPAVEILFPKEVLPYCRLQCNNDHSLYTNMPEVRHIEEYVKDPKTVLDLGCGIGRASVYFHKRFNWNAKVFLVDGDEGNKQIGDGKKPGYYNRFTATELFCTANGLTDFEVSKTIPDRKFDLIYSFLAFGFHWPIEYYDLKPYCHENTKLIFGIQPDTKVTGYHILKEVHEDEALRSSVVVCEI